MRRRLQCMLLCGGAVIGAFAPIAAVRATPPAGFTASTIAAGKFGDIDATNRALGADGASWRSVQSTSGASDLYVQNNVWAPGATTGWHTHPGHSLIIVTAGAITAYEGKDANCRPHVYTAGMGFVDHGGNHVHVLRNEGAVEARTIAVQLIPAGAMRRVDAPGNPHCRF
ncbi:MAG TPA: cupin [Anaeromyxobacter sp.]|nr:cupin [Anaeromyxobacter sp.]